MLNPSDQRSESKSFVCDSCEQFEFAASYTGAEGTRGAIEYDAIHFDECPVCGAAITMDSSQ